MSARILGNTIGATGDLLPDIATDGPVWAQICRAGTYKGHRLGEIEFTAETFTETIRNFRAHPAFRLGPDGKGCAPVVQYDWEHASEMPPYAGSIPQGGAPAAGWVLDLELRMGADQVPELWALSEFLPVARDQIRAGAYRWTSVAIAPESLDPVSGETLHNTLTSVALTNHPFVQGMTPLAASTGEIGSAGSESVIPTNMAEPQIPTPRNSALKRINARFVARGLLKLADAPDEEVAEVAESAADLLDKVKDMVGGKDMDELVAKLAKQCSDAEGASEKQKQIEQLRAALKASSEEKVDDESKAIASLTEGDAEDEKTEKARLRTTKFAKVALLSCINADGLIDQGKRAAILKEYDITPDQIAQRRAAVLTSKILASTDGTQLGNETTHGVSKPLAGEQAKGDLPRILASFTGRNEVERAISYLCSKDPAFKDQSYFTQCEKASAFLATGKAL